MELVCARRYCRETYPNSGYEMYHVLYRKSLPACEITALMSITASYPLNSKCRLDLALYNAIVNLCLRLNYTLVVFEGAAAQSEQATQSPTPK